MFPRLVAYLLIAACTVWVSCADHSSSSASASEALKLKTATLSIEGHSVLVECAVTQPEKSKGLMHRKELAESSGMLFYFKPPQQVSFWMKNTFIPLSIAYLDNTGKILEIYPLTPLDTNVTTSRSYRIQYALEMNQGWFKERGIKPGAQVKGIPSLP